MVRSFACQETPSLTMMASLDPTVLHALAIHTIQ
jgi:hypothetical protein